MASPFTPRTAADLEVGFPKEIDHLSSTSLKMLARCPEQFRRRYIRGDKAPPAGALVWGDADHKAIQWNFEEKLRTGDDQPVVDVKAKFIEAAERRVEEDGGITEIDWGDEAPIKAYDDLRVRGPQLTALYREQVAPFFMPKAIEERYERDDLAQVPITGYIDLRVSPMDPFTQEVKEEVRIVERKTAARAKKTIDPEWVLQGRMYQVFSALPVEWQVSVKTREPRVQVAESALYLPINQAEQDRTKILIGQLTRMVGYLYHTYGPDQAWPGTALVHPWACGYCGFRPQCPWWPTP